MKKFDQEILRVLISKNYHNINANDIKFDMIYHDFGPDGNLLIVSRIHIPSATIDLLELKTFTLQSEYDMMIRDKKLSLASISVKTS
jgi:hypothetical protein